MKIGNINISNLKLGTVQIKKVFIGLDLVWTSFLSIINDFKARVLSSQGEFEGETCLNNTLEDMGIDLFDQASLVITPNGYKENLLFAVKPDKVGTNLLLQTAAFTTPWIISNQLDIENYLQPFGNSPAKKFTVKSTYTTGNVAIQHTTITANLGDYTFSIFVKNINAKWILFQIDNNFSVLGYWVNIEDYTLGSIRNSNNSTFDVFSLNNFDIIDYPDGWKRIVLGFRNVSSATIKPTLFITNTNGTLSPSTSGDSVILFAPQLVTGPTVTDYISTTDRAIINGTIGDLTVTRATTGTRVNSDGLIEVVPYNLFQQSETFDNAYWTKTGSYTLTPNATIAPDGTLTADLFTKTGAINTVVSIIRGSLYTTTGVYTLSFYCKQNVGNNVLFRMDASGNSCNCLFNFTTKTLTNIGANVISSSYEELPNGWFRLILVGNVINTNWNADIANLFSNPSNDSVFVWGAQLVNGIQPKDYFPTTNRFNIPRLDYSNGSCPSILVELQRTNLLAQSADFTNGWTQEGSSITGNTQTGPDGLLSADSIFELGTNDVHRTYRPSITVTANAIYTASFFVKKNNIRYVRLILTQNGSTTIWAGAQFDLDTQTFTSQVGTGGGVFSVASITPFVNGWYRISVSGSIPGTSMIPMLALSNGSALLNTDTRGCPIYLGNTSNSLFIWGAQLEAGSNATSYIPTTTGSVTRNADVITNTNASTLIGQTEGSMYVEFNNTPYVTSGGGYRWLLCIRDPLTNNYLKIYRNTALNVVNRVGMEFHNGTFVNLFSTSNTYNMPLGRNKVLVTYQNGLYKLFQNGALRATVSNSLTVPTNMSRIDVGSFVENVYANLNDGVYTAALYKTVLTDAQAIQLTTL